MIPKSVKVVNTWSFAFCKNLRYVRIGNGTTKMHTSAFGDCENVKKIVVSGDIKGNSYGLLPISTKTTVYCKKGTHTEKYAKDCGAKIEYIK